MADQADSIFKPGTDNAPNLTSNDTNTSTTTSDTGTKSLLVGEGRKYKTYEDLEKAYLHQDDFVEKLKDENRTLREATTKAKTIDDVLERLKAQGSDTSTTDNSTSKGLTVEEVTRIVRNTLTGHETARTRQENLLKADGLMKKHFGEKAQEVFLKETATPEKRKAYVDLAEVAPEKFVALFVQDGSKSTFTSGADSSESKVNVAAADNPNMQARALDPGTREYYTELRRKDPSKYYSAAVQLQMNKVALADPTKFFGRQLET